MNNKLTLSAVLVSASLAFIPAGAHSAPPGSGNTTAATSLQLSGTPDPDASVGTAWRFAPQVSGGDGKKLRWKIQNTPAWTSFDRSTGALAGTPTEGNVGTSSRVRISVTDGRSTATLPEFSITVHSRNATTGTAELNWAAPTERTDGSPVGQLAGYRVLYGTASGAYDQSVRIDNPSVTQYLVEHLAPGTWYFAITAITADALESAPSAEVSKSEGG
jgi:hypothetical protein